MKGSPSCNPSYFQLQEKVHEELDCVLGDKSEVTEEDLKELVYLEQVSAANWIFRRATRQI